MITREEAFDLLKKYNKDPFHIQHALTVEAVMKWYATALGYEKDAEFWGIVGLLHDIDFELYPDEHCLKAPELLTETELADILKKIPTLKKWIEDLWDYATQEALKGHNWNGLKLVEGRSNRKYKNEKLVEEAAKKAGYKDIYKLITITEMEKLMGKKTFNEVLGSLVDKPVGKPTLVDETDPRPAITNVNNEFKKEN